MPHEEKMSSAQLVKDAISAFEGVTWINCGDPEPYDGDPLTMHPGWVKFGIEKSELGWRLLEFLGWLTSDMIRAGEKLEFFPNAPPPYLNEPGECLSLVIEIHPQDGDENIRFLKVAEFINDCREKYWEECKP